MIDDTTTVMDGDDEEEKDEEEEEKKEEDAEQFYSKASALGQHSFSLGLFLWLTKFPLY